MSLDVIIINNFKAMNALLFFPLFWSRFYIKVSFFCLANGILLTTTLRKNCSRDQEKLLKFEAEGREFAKYLRSLEQFIQTVKGQNNFW